MENSAIFKPLLSTTHAPINAHFSKNSNDFVVRENPLYEFSGEGEHMVAHIQKKDLTTAEAIKILSAATGVKARDFGFAGLKDKEGLTSQYISLPYKSAAPLETFSHEKLKILGLWRHGNKIRTGHLKSNSFFIRLKKVAPSEATRLACVLANIDKNGFPNYFGYQRFGKFEDNAASGLEILKNRLAGKKSRLNPKLTNFMISAYQSDLFNRWLSCRVEISRFASDFSEKELAGIYGFAPEIAREISRQSGFYRLIRGEVLGHYPHGAVFLCEDMASERAAFEARAKTSCGLIVGSKAFAAEGAAKKIEDGIFAPAEPYKALMNGTRRFAWIWAENLAWRYDEENAWFSVEFTLPKGAYATVFLRELLGREISNLNG